MQKGQKRRAVGGVKRAELRGTKVPNYGIGPLPHIGRYRVRWHYRADSPIATTTCSFDSPRFLVRWMRDFLGPAIVVIDKLWEVV